MNKLIIYKTGDNSSSGNDPGTIATGLPVGYYSVVVFSANGISGNGSITIDNQLYSNQKIQGTPDFHPNYPPYAQKFYQIVDNTCTGGEDTYIYVFDFANNRGYCNDDFQEQQKLCTSTIGSTANFLYSQGNHYRSRIYHLYNSTSCPFTGNDGAGRSGTLVLAGAYSDANSGAMATLRQWSCSNDGQDMSALFTNTAVGGEMCGGCHVSFTCYQ
jgi:hypothetical protein